MADLIDRQAAIDALVKRWVWITNCDNIGKYIAEECKTIINGLPSAQPDHSGDVNGKVSFTEKERGMLKKMRTLHNGTYADLLDRLVASAQEDADSAYTEGYTYAESKYRKIFDEFLGIVFCKDCKHWRHDDHICQYYGGASPRLANDFCSKGERRTDEGD